MEAFDLLTPAVGRQILMMLTAFVFCSLIGIERQVRQKAAGYRTHVLVGLGACAFTLISAYGFAAAPDTPRIQDPARIAAQVVSGTGFLGAGVIFKGRDVVRGLTTAASIWVAAAVGMACGAQLAGLAAMLTALHLLTLFLVSPLVRLLPTADRRKVLRISYADGQGVLRSVLGTASDLGLASSILRSRRLGDGDYPTVQMDVRFLGRLPLRDLVPALMEVHGVRSVSVHGLARSGTGDEDDDEMRG